MKKGIVVEAILKDLEREGYIEFKLPLSEMVEYLINKMEK